MIKVFICRGERLAPEFLTKGTGRFGVDWYWSSSSAYLFTFDEAERMLAQLNYEDEEEAYMVYIND